MDELVFADSFRAFEKWVTEDLSIRAIQTRLDLSKAGTAKQSPKWCVIFCSPTVEAA
jgi:hypothetical protein